MLVLVLPETCCQLFLVYCTIIVGVKIVEQLSQPLEHLLLHNCICSSNTARVSNLLYSLRFQIRLELCPSYAVITVCVQLVQNIEILVQASFLDESNKVLVLLQGSSELCFAHTAALISIDG